MAQIFPIDFEEKTTMAQDDYILFSDSEDGNKIKKAQYSNLKGEKGDPGTPGTPGTPGKDGEDGESATITVGSVSTLPAGSSATVTNSGTTSAAVLNFGIPEGATGAPGKDGEDGEDGTAATITVGTTTTLPAGSSATVENVGTSQDAILNFGIPKGDSGTGDVIGPASSTDGDIVLFDGATGKLIKDSGVGLSSKLDATALSNNAYGGGWNGDTTHTPTKNAIYTKIHTMDVEIGNKAADTSVVKLTGNQTIAGTKTFSTSPVVPAKSTDAANSDTAIATEAQVYKKQDKLTTQTAYTSKGTATKVPTITTNTLGQVTGITETDISFPVTSVNGSTGAVTISEGNTKTFYASTSSQRNTTLGQQVYDWIKNGNYAILQYGIQNVVIFTPTNTTTGSIYSQGYYTVRGSGDELESVATTYGITVSSGTVTAVDTSPTVSSVGDFFSPGGTATTGYVVTKTAGGYEWQAPSGGDVMVSSQSGNILTSGMKIWAGTQANYESLGTYDNNTVYLTI